MKTKPLPKYLLEALTAVAHHPGDDIYFALGYLSKSTARSYLARLNRRGLAYTHYSNRTTEVWATAKGYKQVTMQ